MTQRAVCFGILGCGMIANFHADALAQLADARLAGVADAMPASAEKFAESRKIKAYADYHAMLADPEIDAPWSCR